MMKTLKSAFMILVDVVFIAWCLARIFAVGVAILAPAALEIVATSVVKKFRSMV